MIQTITIQELELR